MSHWRVIVGDVRERLAEIESESVQCCITSPPYWNLRDYGHDEQIGREKSPSEYVETMVQVFRQVRRVMKHDGVLWLNLGDCYDGKQLVGIPWTVAFALKADEWYLRSDVIWSKPNPMPESVTDRPTKSHEYVFLMTKSPRYFYDAEAIAEGASGRSCGNRTYKYDGLVGHETKHGILKVADKEWHQRNARSVWSITTQPYPDAHFATFPEELPERCIKAGSRVGDLVLDPFCGSGTTGKVAIQLGRSFVGIELNSEYAEMARRRIGTAAPLFAVEHNPSNVIENLELF